MSRSALDAFEQLKQIGKGSYGEVTLARHKKDRKQYVLKRITLQKASKRERTSAEQEAKLLSRLKHPNIVSYKDSFEIDGILYIAMQFCEGGDLYNKLKENKGQALEERQVVEWFVQIAMALQYMHERNILHRDLKTQNIFLTKSKIIKVGDLGIARVLDSSSDMATTLIGTPYYMSPELFSNKPYNHKSDVWALGCCVYEMATLKHAFNAKDMNSLVYKILRGRMPPMPKLYSSELLQIIKNMLHQDPDKRPSVNRILRDPYIKKNISIFLEETKKSIAADLKSRPSSASRPNSAARSRAASSRSVNHPRPPPVPVPQDVPDSGRSDKEKVSVFHVQASNHREPPPPEPQPVPVVIRKSSHASKPSEAARPELTPIAEDKQSKTKESSSSDSDDDTMKAKTVKEQKQPSSPKKSNGGSPRKKKKESWMARKNAKATEEDMESVNSVESSASNAKSNKESVFKNYSGPTPKYSDKDFEQIKEEYVSSSTGKIKKNVTFLFRPKPVVTPRPLPQPPKVEESQGLPQHRFSSQIDERSTGESKSSSSSREENASWDNDTPRSLPNISARQRRREQTTASQERPQSARQVRLKRPEMQKPKATRSEYGPISSKQSSGKKRQPSIQDDSSSSEDDTLKENGDFKRDKEKHRENKEMNNFISLLDTTLHLNKEDEKSDEDAEKAVVQVEEIEVPENNGAVHRSASLPSVETLCSANRLMSRIQILHKDCVNGVGFETLHKAYQILSNIEDDEVEPQLVQLMGKDKFDLYAGKIWQLKFCEECFEQLPQLQS